MVYFHFPLSVFLLFFSSITLKYKLQRMQIWCYLMVKTVRVSEKISEQLTVVVGRITAEKLEKQTYSDAVKYLLDHHVVFPPELTSHIEE